jgi:hypothetical protein
MLVILAQLRSTGYAKSFEPPLPEVRGTILLRTRVHKVYAYDLGLLVEDVLDLPERIGREDVSEPQVRCPRVRQGMEDVGRYEDR